MEISPPDFLATADDARKIGRTSGRSARVEVLARAERRRSWTIEQKREIVSQSLGPGLTPTEVARKHAISSGQLYTWRQQLLSFQGAMVTQTASRLASVDLALVPRPLSPEPAVSSAPSVPSRPEGLIEIVLSDGLSLRVDAHVDGRALRRVLDALGR